MVRVREFLTRVEQIAAEEPRYQHGHDGSDGLCDCIGLIIGAIRRAGGQWRGMHGSNYAARSEIRKLRPIKSAADLRPGEAVFKAYKPGTGGYNLPARYDPGGSSYNGDLNDYYHVGVVVSVNPLRIRHMTTPKPKLDTDLGKWAYHGELIKVEYAGEVEPMGQVIISGGNTAAPVRLRKAASTGSAILAEIPQGAAAELVQAAGSWSKILYNGVVGYVMSEFVHEDKGKPEPEPEQILVNRADLERIYDALGDVLGLRG